MYDIGEQVRIRAGFDKTRISGDPGINLEMKKMVGEIHTISDRSIRTNHTRYYFSDGDWTWMEEWLEPVEPELPDINEDDFMVMFNG